MKKLYVVPTLLWFGSFVVLYLVPSIASSGRYSRLQFLLGALQIPAALFGCLFIARDWPPSLGDSAMSLTTVVGVLTFAIAIYFLSTIQ